MKVKYLGTAASEGWPAVFCGCEPCEKARLKGGKDIRFRSSVLINDSILVDFPLDIFHHSMAFNIKLGEIEHLVITHSHPDHFCTTNLVYRGEPFSHNEKTLKVYSNKTVHSIMEKLLKDVPRLVKNVIPNFTPPFKPYQAGNMKVTPLLALHNRKEPCYIYIFEGEDGKRMLYGNDTGIFPEETWEYISGIYFDLVSLDCTFGPLPEGNNHMGIPDNLKVKKKMIEMGCADQNTKFIITHFSHNSGFLHDELVKAGEPHQFEVAYDGFEVFV